MVDVIDQQVGRVIKYLEDNGELDNTVRGLNVQMTTRLTLTVKFVLFMSDK